MNKFRVTSQDGTQIVLETEKGLSEVEKDYSPTTDIQPVYDPEPEQEVKQEKKAKPSKA